MCGIKFNLIGGKTMLKKVIIILVGTVMILKGAGATYNGMCIASQNAINGLVGSYGVTVDFTGNR